MRKRSRTLYIGWSTCANFVLVGPPVEIHEFESPSNSETSECFFLLLRTSRTCDCSSESAGTEYVDDSEDAAAVVVVPFPSGVGSPVL